MEMKVGQQGLKEKFNELPGFRFHPTEQELVGFYLKRMVQGKLHNFNFIPMLHLYRYDPSDLPRFASLGERELFFFVPREERSQNNRGRPNRMTASGYWKATGCDRSVHNNNGKCIGLKKTLVFYRGRAPRGQKTDWIMNEYRLPDYFDKPKKEVVLCRIYRKATPLKWLEHRAMSQAEVLTSTCEDFDCISQDSQLCRAKIDENKRVHEARSICVWDSDSVACHEIRTEQSSSPGDNATKTDIISSLGCPLSTGPVESTACGNFVDPNFQGFADVDKGVEEFSSIIAMLNSSASSSVECCWELPLIPEMAEGLGSVQIPKRSTSFRNVEVASDGKWNTWKDLWSLSSI